jgi:presenilin-like A22 family membrane protease
MKHTLRVTLIIVALFVVAQIVGLSVVNSYLGKEEVVVDGKVVTNVTWGELPYGVERPEFEEQTSFFPLMVIILIATFLILAIMKLRLFKLWKFWFFLSVWFCLAISAYVFLGQQLGMIVAGVLAFGKVVWRNIYLHNFTEIFIYGGLAAVFVPFLSLFSISVLLLLISVYDAIAVWKTKHMVSMAKFQTKMKLFAGLLVPYGKKHAILGGGDIGFPLFFSGVVLKNYGWIEGLIVTMAVSLALLILLIKSEKNKYYPAMPFLTAGCFLGLLIVYLI